MTNRWGAVVTLAVALLAPFCFLACSVPSASSGADGETFVVNKLSSLNTNWDISTWGLDKRLDSKLIVRAFKQYGNILGPVQKVGTVERGQSKTTIALNMPDYIGAYRATLTCKKGEATAIIVAEHLNGKWLVQNISLDSSLFKNIGAKERASALAFAKSFLQKWCESGFAFEMLRENADPECAEELRKDEVPSKLIFATMQKMGKLKDLSDAKLLQILPVEDRFIFSIVQGGDFENLHADMCLQVLKQGTLWKIHNFQIQSKNITASLLP